MTTSLRIGRLLILAAAFTLIAGISAASAQTTPQTHDEFVQAGVEAARKGDFAAAANWYTKALERQPDNFDVMYSRAGCYMVLQKYDAALKDQNALLKARPNFVPVLHLRATTYNAKGEYKKGLADAEAILKLEPENSNGFQARGGAKLGLGKYAEAEADLNESIRRDPKNHVTYSLRSVAYLGQGKTAQSQADKLKAEQLQRGQ